MSAQIAPFRESRQSLTLHFIRYPDATTTMFDIFAATRRRSRHSRRRRAALVFSEALESRTLLSGNVAASLQDGKLSLLGDRADNSVEITVEGDDLVVRGRDGTTINDSTEDFVIAAGATAFDGDVDVHLGAGADTFVVTGPLTIAGDITLFDFIGAGEFAITDATVEGDVRVHSGDSSDVVSLVDANIDGGLSLHLSDGRNFVSLLDSSVGGLMTVHTGNRNDVILLDGSMVGGLDVSTGDWIDDVILRDTTIDGDFDATTGGGRDFILVEDSTVSGDTRLLLWWDSDLIVTQGDVEFAGNFLATGIAGRNDTIEMSEGTTVGGESHIVLFEHHSLGSLTGVNARIDRRLAEAFEYQVLLNGAELGELTLTVDTSSNTDAVQSNNTLITRAETFTIEGTTLPRSTVSVTAGTGGSIDLGSDTADGDGHYSITIDLLHGPTKIMVTATDILDRMVTEEFSLHVAVGTVVRFETSEGSFDVELYDDDAPLTVANFLNYFERYEDSIIHRNAIVATDGVDVIQGGGFALDDMDDLQPIMADAPVMGESSLERSNVRGTLAMALVGNNPNSATSQWYINVNDNTALDPLQYTVFGEVIGDGLDVIDAIFAFDRFDINDVVPAGGGALSTVPLENYTLEQVQLTGTVSMAVSSIQVDGTGTVFTTELEVDDIIEIDGERFRVIAINSDTELLVDADHPNAPIVNADFFTEPIATTVPTRDQYVVFDSIGVLL